VASLDQDRILRSFLSLINATLRTNFYQRESTGDFHDYVSFKFDPAMIADLPAPRPKFEIWVYSPRVEGVHLRFGAVARGGLRWSDRREDFRTEVLGLVKAQMVKNAVIVPVGAKGGFFVKRSPDPTVDRDAWLAEGIACYRVFISALLDITDNLVAGKVVPPKEVLRYDADDPYLVVAADKGTATFSDIANGVAMSYDFWLGDAFASGGSAGYDHKAMGITARGAWESVKRHFRELGVDTQTTDFTVIGIGDMSGDVFGNGMLLSEHIRLIAAFDHRHIFIDPNPDAATSFAERRRLFNLPRSSWADYDLSLISGGGGIFARSLKSIPLTTEIRQALGISEEIERMTPQELMRACLTAQVDLLWNGGIGTYVKSSHETNAEVGDKSNDAIRINGAQLRATVVGEGGNLGFTQLGRIEAAQVGVKLNTDAIDNSAGVDTSDHEVNIKILLDQVVRDGAFTVEARNELLAGMTDEVAELVLHDNYAQNVALGNDRSLAVQMLSVQKRFIRTMEAAGDLDRVIEFLPTDADMDLRISTGHGLTSPELAVLLAYAKITLTTDLTGSTLGSEPWFASLLRGYFPDALVEQFGDRLDSHPLRSQIITTVLSNDMINDGGSTFVFRAQEETGAGSVEIARAYVVSREVFGLKGFWDRIASLDNQIPTAAQTAMYLESRRLLDRATRWVIMARGGRVDVAAEIARMGDDLIQMAAQVPDFLVGIEHDRLVRRTEELEALGAPHELAVETASLLDAYGLLDVVEVARLTGSDPRDVARLYFVLSERYEVDIMLTRITQLPRDDRWGSLARMALRSDLYGALAGLTRAVVEATPGLTEPVTRVEIWESHQAEGLARAKATLDEIAAIETFDVATLSVALRTIRTLVR
jgi:glutamate dehydrogenase